jgi:hypothetical protein
MKQQAKKSKSWFIIGSCITVLVFGLLLSGCGGSSGDNDLSPTVMSDPNGEGVRKVVRKSIEMTHADSAKKRAALFQHAKVVEKALVDADDKQLSIQHANESNRANTCLWYTFGSVTAYGNAQDRLKSVILNTDERNKAYLMYDSQLSGEVFKGIPYEERAGACDIDPTTLSD